MRKVWIFILSLVAICFVGVSFADVIPDNSHYLKRCSKLKNAEIDKYNIVCAYTYEEWPAGCWHGPVNLCEAEESKLRWKVVEYNMEECLPIGNMEIYFLDERENINNLTQDNIQDKAIFIGNISVKPSGYVNNSIPKIEETLVYKIEKDGDGYKLILESGNKIKSEMLFKCEDCVDAEEESENIDEDVFYDVVENMSEDVVKNESTDIMLENDKLKDFCIAWILTILIEVVALFDIAKLFRKNDQILNLRLILVGILASTVTLPLLRFVLPLFIVDGVEYTVVGELLVTLIEVFIIKYGLKISWGKAILASVVCNLCSYALGLLIM